MGNVPFNVNVPGTYLFSAPATVVHAHPITFSPTVFTGNGAVISTNQYTFNTYNRDVVISTTPGSMVPVAASFYCKKLNNGLGVNLYITFNAAVGKCPLSKNVQYYLNMKANQNNYPIDYLLSPAAQN